jgi:hypothetical protein
MVRISKQAERRSQTHRKNKGPSIKTGPLKDRLAKGYNERPNALSGEVAEMAYIPKIK